MNKIILVVLIAGTAVAQYPSPNYVSSNRGADVSSAYSQRGGQYANGPAAFGARLGGYSGYQNSNAGSYSSSSSNAGSYSSSKSGSYAGAGAAGSNGGYVGAAVAGPTSGGYSAQRGYSGANQGSYGRVGSAAYNGGASAYNGGASAYNGGASGYNGGRGAYNAQDDLSEPAKYEFKYDVFAPEYYNEFGHAEQRDGDYTSGSYYVLLPDGRRQVVEYTADQDGYKPRITYTEAAPGAYNRQGAGYNGQGAGYNGQGATYNGQGAAYNGQGAAYNGQAAAYNGQAAAYNGQAAAAYNGQAAAYNGQRYNKGPSPAVYSSSGPRNGGY